jgi:hypothetical protein
MIMIHIEKHPHIQTHVRQHRNGINDIEMMIFTKRGRVCSLKLRGIVSQAQCECKRRAAIHFKIINHKKGTAPEASMKNNVNDQTKF